MGKNKVSIQLTLTGLSRVKTAFRKLDASIGKVRSSILNLKTVFAAAGIGVVIKKLSSESIKFEDALLDLQKVMSDVDGDARQFTGTVKALSDRFGVSAADVLQGAANFKQAGFEIKESFELQKIALETANVSQLSVAESSELLISTLKGFKAPASEAGRLTDVLNEISNRYATSLKELGIGMAGLSPIANKMGFSLEETAGVLTPVIEVFRSGSEAAIALKTGLLRLISDQKPVQDALESIGVSQRDINGELRSGKDIINDVALAFTNMNENQKLYITGQLVGIEQAGRMVEVFDGLSKSTEVTGVALAAAGSRLKEVEIRLASAGIKLAGTREAFNNMAKSLGDVLMPTILNAADRLKEFFNAVQGDSAIAGFKVALEEIKKIVKVLVQDVASLGKFIFQLPAGIKAAAVAVLLLSTSMAQVAFVVVGIEAAIKTFPVLWNLVIEANSRAVLLMLQGVNKVIDAVNKIPGVKLGKIDTSGQEALVEHYTNITIESQKALEANKTLVQSLIDGGKEIKKALGTTKAVTFDASPAAPVSATASADHLPETVRKQGGKTVEAWRKALDEFKVVTDAQMKETALSSLKSFQEIENSGKLTGARLAAVWQGQVGPDLVAVFDTLDKDTQDMVLANNKRFEEMASKGITEIDRLGANTRDVLTRMKGPFTDFFDSANKGFLNLQSLVGNVVSVIRRKLAELAADKAISFLIKTLTGGIGGGGGFLSGIVGSIFGKRPHGGGHVGSLPTQEILTLHKGGLASDETLAKLKKKEFVFNEEVTASLGKDRLNRINSGDFSDFESEGSVPDISGILNQAIANVQGLVVNAINTIKSKLSEISSVLKLDDLTATPRQLSFAGIPRIPTDRDFTPAFRTEEFAAPDRGANAAGRDKLNRINNGDISDFTGRGGGNGGSVTVLATINLNAIDTQSGVEFASRPENLEVYENAIRQAIAGNGRKSLGL